jgi:hypothetical protein
MAWRAFLCAVGSLGVWSCAEGGGGGIPPLPDAGAPEDAGRDAGERDAGHDAGEPDAGNPDADAGEPDAGNPVDACVAVTTCGAPVMLGSLSGDSGAENLMFEGAGNAFIAVQVREDDGGVLRNDLKVLGTLTSPASTNFDLFLYAEQNGCASITDSSTTDFLDIVDATWGEDLNSNDDSRTVVFEVRHVSGSCSDATPWRLEVRGNTN